MEQRILELLGGVEHPELGGDIVSLGIARDVKFSEVDACWAANFFGKHLKNPSH